MISAKVFYCFVDCQHKRRPKLSDEFRGHFQDKIRCNYPVFFLEEGKTLRALSSTPEKAFLKFYKNPGEVRVKIDSAKDSHTIFSSERYEIERYQLAPP